MSGLKRGASFFAGPVRNAQELDSIVRDSPPQVPQRKHHPQRPQVTRVLAQQAPADRSKYDHKMTLSFTLRSVKVTLFKESLRPECSRCFGVPTSQISPRPNPADPFQEDGEDQENSTDVTEPKKDYASAG